jgi:hypothetical protein
MPVQHQWVKDVPKQRAASQQINRHITTTASSSRVLQDDEAVVSHNALIYVPINQHDRRPVGRQKAIGKIEQQPLSFRSQVC